MMVGYPDTIKELMIRERVKDSSFDEALHFLLNEWTALRLLPHTINIVSCVYPILIAKVLDKWLDSGISRPTDHIGHLDAGITPPSKYYIYTKHKTLALGALRAPSAKVLCFA